MPGLLTELADRTPRPTITPTSGPPPSCYHGVPDADTPFAINERIGRYESAVAAGQNHPVLLSGLFILDLLVIHPFEDGNGRVARVLANAILIDHGYTVGRYVSLEQAVSESADAYYQALLESTQDW